MPKKLIIGLVALAVGVAAYFLFFRRRAVAAAAIPTYAPTPPPSPVTAITTLLSTPPATTAAALVTHGVGLAAGQLPQVGLGSTTGKPDHLTQTIGVEGAAGHAAAVAGCENIWRTNPSYSGPDGLGGNCVGAGMTCGPFGIYCIPGGGGPRPKA